jgi:AcrR family transcriptional regulator
MERRSGSRLSREQRRAQLVELGMRLFSERSFDEVSVDRVAEEAGISRSLLFHYFPTKHDFQVAVARAATEELLASTEPDPALPPVERLRASLAAYIDYVSDRREAFLSLVRGASGGGAQLRAVVDRAHDEVARRILDGLGLTAAQTGPMLRVAIHGWIAFMEEAVVRWLLEEEEGSRETLLDVLEQVLVGALVAVYEEVPEGLRAPRSA